MLFDAVLQTLGTVLGDGIAGIKDLPLNKSSLLCDFPVGRCDGPLVTILEREVLQFRFCVKHYGPFLI